MSQRPQASAGVNAALLDLHERHVVDDRVVHAVTVLPTGDRRLGAALWALTGALIDRAGRARVDATRLFAALGMEGDLAASATAARAALHRRLLSLHRGRRMPSREQLRAEADRAWLTYTRRELRAALRDRRVRERGRTAEPQARDTLRTLLRG
jgi:hypothetical protein